MTTFFHSEILSLFLLIVCLCQFKISLNLYNIMYIFKKLEEFLIGCKQKLLSTEEPMVISDIKPGSVAHRSGALAPGDQLLAINGQPLHNLSLVRH